MAPEHTEDGRWIVVDGRRWRATDPAIPAPFRKELVAELMRARRERDRPATGDAKVALGERGPRWWDPPTPDGDRQRLAAAVRTLLRHRGPEKTICPSDAAQAVGGARWRSLLPLARDVARDLAGAGTLEVTQRGEAIDPSRPWKGPVRLRLRPSAARRDEGGAAAGPLGVVEGGVGGGEEPVGRRPR
jgi:hypothetical protein